MLFQLTMFPSGSKRKGVSVSEHVAKVIDIIDKSGLPYKLTPMATCIEGNWEEKLSRDATVKPVLELLQIKVDIPDAEFCACDLFVIQAGQGVADLQFGHQCVGQQRNQTQRQGDCQGRLK